MAAGEEIDDEPRRRTAGDRGEVRDAAHAAAALTAIVVPAATAVIVSMPRNGGC
ncbi:hypothetical protein IWX63_002707 [Arthrobacter sp. CAN_A2]|uniref:hypothetical protein n=1 Tax=Arthrobacter sp. CAN_A2 TaxID=2787718 RepID=UPI0018EFB5D0